MQVVAATWQQVTSCQHTSCLASNKSSVCSSSAQITSTVSRLQVQKPKQENSKLPQSSVAQNSPRKNTQNPFLLLFAVLSAAAGVVLERMRLPWHLWGGCAERSGGRAAGSHLWHSGRWWMLKPRWGGSDEFCNDKETDDRVRSGWSHKQETNSEMWMNQLVSFWQRDGETFYFSLSFKHQLDDVRAAGKVRTSRYPELEPVVGSQRSAVISEVVSLTSSLSDEWQRIYFLLTLIQFNSCLRCCFFLLFFFIALAETKHLGGSGFSLDLICLFLYSLRVTPDESSTEKHAKCCFSTQVRRLKSDK